MSLIAAGIAGAAALGSTIFGSSSAKKQNTRAFDFQREMWNKQGQREVDYWNMQNEYNHPAKQMERLQASGLNPNLVYGNGADAQSGQLKSGGAPSAPAQMDQSIDLTSVAQQALSAKQLQANISRTEAETDRIKQGTQIGQFELEAMRELGQSKLNKQLQAKVASATNADIKKIREFDAWLNMAFRTSDGGDIVVDQFGSFPMSGSKFVDDSVSATVRKALVEIDNIKSGIGLRNQQQGINELKKVILQAEADFTRMFGSSTGAGMAIQLLKLIVGR